MEPISLWMYIFHLKQRYQSKNIIIYIYQYHICIYTIYSNNFHQRNNIEENSFVHCGPSVCKVHCSAADLMLSFHRVVRFCIVMYRHDVTTAERRPCVTFSYLRKNWSSYKLRMQGEVAYWWHNTRNGVTLTISRPPTWENLQQCPNAMLCEVHSFQGNLFWLASKAPSIHVGC